MPPPELSPATPLQSKDPGAKARPVEQWPPEYASQYAAVASQSSLDVHGAPFRPRGWHVPFTQASVLPQGTLWLQEPPVAGVGTHFARPLAAAQYELPWHSSPGSAQKSPASFGVTLDVQTD